jgi:hypothetical protein
MPTSAQARPSPHCGVGLAGAGADPKVVQRILGHASADMTMDLYGNLIDQNLWDAADRVGENTGGLSGASTEREAEMTNPGARNVGPDLHSSQNLKRRLVSGLSELMPSIRSGASK